MFFFFSNNFRIFRAKSGKIQWLSADNVRSQELTARRPAIRAVKCYVGRPSRSFSLKFIVCNAVEAAQVVRSKSKQIVSLRLASWLICARRGTAHVQTAEGQRLETQPKIFFWETIFKNNSKCTKINQAQINYAAYMAEMKRRVAKPLVHMSSAQSLDALFSQSSFWTHGAIGEFSS